MLFSTTFRTAVSVLTFIGLLIASPAGQDFLVANIDRNVSPRNDFFHYANGTWLAQHPIPEDQTRWGIWNVVSSELYSQLRRLSEDAAAKPGRRGSASQLIGDFWATGMDSARINRQGLMPLQPDLDRIERITSFTDVMDVISTLHRRPVLIDSALGQRRVLFDGRVEQDESDSRRRIYTLAQGGNSIGRLAYAATNPQGVKAQQALRAYLVKTFTRLHGSSEQARASAEAVYNLEAQIAAGTEQGNTFHKMQVAELSQLAPRIDWRRYFSRLGIQDLEFVNVRQPRFFQGLDSLASATPLDNWKDYLRFWLIKLNAPFLDDETYGDLFAFESAQTGQPEPKPRWRRIVWQEKNWLGLPMAKLFERESLPEKTRARYRAVGEAIRESFKSRIEGLGWMSDSTKQQALLKLARLKITIGVPDNPIDFSTMPLRRDSYVLNIMRAAEWFYDQEIRRLNAPVDLATLDLHPEIGGDAYYDDSNNEVTVASPVQVVGVQEKDLDEAFVYGSTMLGHEIAHAFDSGGRQYDADGNKVDWWTPADAAAFQSRAQVLVDQYSASSLRENMADLVGVRVCLDAFKKTEQFRRNERVGEFTPLQRFLLAYAYGHMGHQRQEPISFQGPVYLPDRERVNGVLMNLDEFYGAFDVKPGDRMYRPEQARARIW
jgi:putative endopeptidase